MADEKKPAPIPVSKPAEKPATRNAAPDDPNVKDKAANTDLDAQPSAGVGVPTPFPEGKQETGTGKDVIGTLHPDAPDKSAESYRQEASAKDTLHAPVLSSETPSERDKDVAEAEGVDLTTRPRGDKLTIEQFIQPDTGGRRGAAVMSDEDKATHERLNKELEDARKGRLLSDIPLQDAYWAKQNELSHFLADLR